NQLLLITLPFHPGRIFAVRSHVDYHSPSPGQSVQLEITDSSKCQVVVKEQWQYASIVRKSKRSSPNSMDDLRKLYYPELVASSGINDRLSPRNRKGLLGEILLELIASDCYNDTELVYVNWH